MTETPNLSPEELAILEPLGERRSVEVGEYLYRSGDTTYDFFVLLSGQGRVTAGDADNLINVVGSGQFFGELNLLTGSRVFLTAQMTEAGEVLAIPVQTLRLVLSHQPNLSDKILATLMARRADLRLGAASATRVIGSRYSRESLRIRELLSRCQLPYEWIDADSDPDVEALLQQIDVLPSQLPVVITGGTVLRRPTPGELAQYLGLTIDRLPDRRFDLIVIGGGPAGMAAAVYGASEGLSTLGFDMIGPGGQAGTSSRIENYFGFPIGISGGDLMQRGMVQAEKFGAQLTAPCQAIALREESGHFVVELSDRTTVAAAAVIAATGARYRRLAVERLESFEGNGVYYAATELEARICAGRPVLIVGGGNSAGQAAIFLADEGSPVTVLIRSPDITAKMSRYLVDRLEDHARITVLTQSSVAALEGEETLTAVRIVGPDGPRVLECSALFFFTGAEPGSEWLSGSVATDNRGFILTDRDLTRQQFAAGSTALGRDPLPFETSRPGLFAAGDVRSGSMKRVAAAVGEGSSAVRSVHAHLAHAGRTLWSEDSIHAVP